MASKNRIVIVALDGTPFSLLERLSAPGGCMPNLKTLRADASFRPMQSVYPPVSSAAWASFISGRSPAEHGIFGFVDRQPATLEWILPHSGHLPEPTLWQRLSQQGRKLFVMNVPMTSPPLALNGVMIGGFLGNDVATNTYPAHIGPLLKAQGYRADADIARGRSDRAALMDELEYILEKRIEALWRFWPQERWDFFMVHIMETDRLHHFFWQDMLAGNSEFTQRFYDLYARIDRLLGDILNEIKQDTYLLLLSDHGFTALEQEVLLNQWLIQEGYLRFKTRTPSSLQDMDNRSTAYSLYPGRIHINLKGREKNGSVSGAREYEKWRQTLAKHLQTLHDPRNGKAVVRRVLYAEALYQNKRGALQSHDPFAHARIPDLLIENTEGYDLKGDLSGPSLFRKTAFNGMHCFDDAFALLHGAALPDEKNLSIRDMHRIILDLMNVTIRNDS